MTKIMILAVVFSINLFSSCSLADELVNDKKPNGEFLFKVEPDESASKIIERRFGKNVLRDAQITARLIWRVDDVWSIHINARTPAVNYHIDGKTVIFRVRTEQSQTVRIKPKEIFRAIATVVIDDEENTNRAIDFEITLQAVNGLQKGETAVAGSVVWGILR